MDGGGRNRKCPPCKEVTIVMPYGERRRSLWSDQRFGGNGLMMEEEGGDPHLASMLTKKVWLIVFEICAEIVVNGPICCPYM